MGDTQGLTTQRSLPQGGLATGEGAPGHRLGRRAWRRRGRDILPSADQYVRSTSSRRAQER